MPVPDEAVDQEHGLGGDGGSRAPDRRHLPLTQVQATADGLLDDRGEVGRCQRRGSEPGGGSISGGCPEGGSVEHAGIHSISS